MDWSGTTWAALAGWAAAVLLAWQLWQAKRAADDQRVKEHVEAMFGRNIKTINDLNDEARAAVAQAHKAAQLAHEAAQQTATRAEAARKSAATINDVTQSLTEYGASRQREAERLLTELQNRRELLPDGPERAALDAEISAASSGVYFWSILARLDELDEDAPPRRFPLHTYAYGIDEQAADPGEPPQDEE